MKGMVFGLTMKTTEPRTTKESFKVHVIDVVPGSPADVMGLQVLPRLRVSAADATQVGDEIVSINGKPVLKHRDNENSVNAIHFTHLVSEIERCVRLELQIRLQRDGDVMAAATREEACLTR